MYTAAIFDECKIADRNQICNAKSASRQRSVGTASPFIATNPEPPTLVSECDFFVQFWRTRKGPNQFADAMRDAE
jgi:hypothetical protein